MSLFEPTDRKATVDNKSTNVFIQKGEVISHFMYPTLIDSEAIYVKLSLNEPVQKTTTFYLHQVGKLRVKKNRKYGGGDIDPDELDLNDNRLLRIGLYKNEHDKQRIAGSNVLQITIPDEDDDNYDDDYKAPSILSSSVKAIETDDEKDQSVYIYFDIPNNLKGEDITFKMISGDDNNKNEQDVSFPFVIKKIIDTIFVSNNNGHRG